MWVMNARLSNPGREFFGLDDPGTVGGSILLFGRLAGDGQYLFQLGWISYLRRQVEIFL